MCTQIKGCFFIILTVILLYPQVFFIFISSFKNVIKIMFINLLDFIVVAVSTQTVTRQSGSEE